MAENTKRIRKKNKIVDKPQQITNRKVSIEAMKRFVSFKIPSVFKNHNLEIIKEKDIKSTFINNVEVTVSPDIIFIIEHNNKRYIGAVKLHLSSRNIFDSKQSRYIATILNKYLIELSNKYNDLKFIIPAANERLFIYLKRELNSDSTPVNVILGHSRDVLASAHLAILASGTAALEAALFAKPMVVMYKVAKLEEYYAARTMVVKHFSMPNHLTDPPIVKELIQEQATVENLVAEVSELLDDQSKYASMHTTLAAIAPALSENSGEIACDAIEQLLASRQNASNPN